jgi:hypothetical protein
MFGSGNGMQKDMKDWWIRIQEQGQVAVLAVMSWITFSPYLLTINRI